MLEVNSDGLFSSCFTVTRDGPGVAALGFRTVRKAARSSRAVSAPPPAPIDVAAPHPTARGGRSGPPDGGGRSAG